MTCIYQIFITFHKVLPKADILLFVASQLPVYCQLTACMLYILSDFPYYHSTQLLKQLLAATFFYVHLNYVSIFNVTHKSFYLL